MGKDSLIGWTDDTRNFWIGCTEVPGMIIDRETGDHAPSACDHCYARAENQDRWNRATWGKGEPRFKCNLKSAVAFMKKANALGMEQGFPRLVFLNSASDAMDEEVPDAWRDEMIFEGIAPFPNLTGLLLTKRTSKLLRYVTANRDRLPKNLAFGTTVATQADADQRLPELCKLRAVIPWPVTLFVSVEPLLERVDLWPWLSFPKKIRDGFNQVKTRYPSEATMPEHLSIPFLDWVIVGGESGYAKPQTRPIARTAPEWITDVVDNCAEYDVACFVKQMGRLLGAELGCADSHGLDVDAWPPGLRVQDWPEAFGKRK